jgi:hypothetical protein
MVDEIIIRKAARGAINDPSTLSLNFIWKMRYAQIMLHEKKDSAALIPRTGAAPSE